ncbi:MAG: hypothetical protein IJZ39_11470 [Oscillospiraceae bacterium]|nr:hypothetical protein [Oscillospiraceae bacterium]
MEIIKTIIATYGSPLAAVILSIVFGTLGMIAKKLFDKYIDTPIKEAVARTAAAFVEQIWKDIHGAEKLQKALETAEILLKKKGLAFDAEEMKILIEAAVAEFNDAFAKPLIQEDTAAAVRRTEQGDV